MKNRPCTLEDRVLEATRSEGLTEELNRHLSTCRSCSDAVAIDNLLQIEARAVPSLPRLPDPGRIWLRARQQRLLQTAERVTGPIRAVERIALVAGSVGLAVGTALAWPMVRSWVGRTISILGDVGGSANGILPSNPVPLVAAALLFLVLFGLYSELVEA
jgi:hypothetical protein